MFMSYIISELKIEFYDLDLMLRITILGQDVSVWSLYVLAVSVWVLSGYVCFLQSNKDAAWGSVGLLVTLNCP